MKVLLLLVMSTACAALVQDLSGKMFTFPQETNRAHVQLNTLKRNFSGVTVCHRSFTDLKRDHMLFSLSTPNSPNDFLIFWDNTNKEMEAHIRNKKSEYGGRDYKPNTWHSICTTWDSATGLTQLWFNGQPSIRKFTFSGSNISGPVNIIVGQEQDSHGGGFDLKQSFVGMMSDVHMWDYVISGCEIQKYVDERNFTPGNVLNWAALDYETVEKMLLFLLLVTSCAAVPQNLSEKMFTFPQETNTAHVRLTSRQNLKEVTVCFRFFTDLKRNHTLFSLAIPSHYNAFLFFNLAKLDSFEMSVRNMEATFEGLDLKLNQWQSLCATWDYVSGLVQLWVDGKPSIKKFTSSGSSINEPIIITLGQDQDSYGGNFDVKQSFVGMMTDLHMWDSKLSPCDIWKYAKAISNAKGNVLNWNSLEFEIIGNVLIENKQYACQ